MNRSLEDLSLDPAPDPVLDGVRSRLTGKNGRAYWNELEALSDEPAFREWLVRERPAIAEGLLDPKGRREFLRLMGASLAVGGIGACTRQPLERIMPYARNPEGIVPGKPLYFATAMPFAGASLGILVESHMGRPTKVEGNPEHPSSLGASDAFAQAAPLDLYDPDRAQVITNKSRISTLPDLLGVLREELAVQRGREGDGLRVLTGTAVSPTLAWQLRELYQEFPGYRWHQYEAVNRDRARGGAMRAFGRDVATRYDFQAAEVVLSLDADFLVRGPGRVRDAIDFSAKRRVRASHGGHGESPTMNRLYCVESGLSVTGANADHRLALTPSGVEELTRAVAARLSCALGRPADIEGLDLEEHLPWIDALVADLRRAGSASLVLAGEDQPEAVHAICHAMNAALGSVGRTVVYTDPIEAEPTDQQASLRQLVGDMEAGRVEVLVVLGGNPVYDAPADFEFARHLENVPFRLHHSLYRDETTDLCHWHVPSTHFLESWSDCRGHDGTASIVQPLIAPLYDGLSEHEMVAVLAGKTGAKGYDVVREYWSTHHPASQASGFDVWWRRALHDGLIPDTSFPARSVALLPTFDAAAAPPHDSGGSLEVVFRPDATVWDGRFANNGWLQELPKPVSLLTWDNAVFIAPRTAELLALENEDEVELSMADRSVLAPIWIVPGHAAGCVTLPLGYGRRRSGRVGTGAGFDAYTLRFTSPPSADVGFSIRKTGERRLLATTQNHDSMEGRDLARLGAIEDFGEESGHGAGHENTSMYPPVPTDNRARGEGSAWAMVIDLNACIGCNACMIACQSENNISVVGRDQVRRGREMHWIRVDRYFEGEEHDVEVRHQPVPCMHCENAPCEVVCPVGATTHSPEGLNEMTYNRCVGTRYCANNCPYKVRRFNYYYYVDEAEPLAMGRNPDVTVRSRGVMEKCTYCVQRINEKRILAKKEDREIADGEIVTACQSVCPARAIVFGDINDEESEVSHLRHEPHHYGILEELNTQPRTTYLARFRNRNPDIEAL